MSLNHYASYISKLVETDNVHVTHQVVTGFGVILSILGSYDGPVDIPPTPDVSTSFTFHSDIFWIDWTHSVLQSWRKSSQRQGLKIILLTDDHV